VTRSDLVIQLAERFGQLTHRDTEFAVKTILDAMASALARGHRIEIRGFGSFSINRRPPRVGRNPRSGEQVVISKSWCRTSSRARPCARPSTSASAPCVALPSRGAAATPARPTS
jgi:integration host factor subunit beta